ncbi:MAG: methionine--tRNA ligase [Elusimicrobia bacterium]|nr:methionine--tRNA ligase [Elusimicrobiota bacterium]
MLNKFYITTAIDYVNAAPHIGHAYEKICADVIARWHRMKKEDVYFLTGTDENAQKNVQAAREAGVDTKIFVDNNSKKFVELCRKLNISNDDFIKTTEERHIRVAQLIFKRMYDKGDIYKGFYEGCYCDGCEGFITEKELKDGKCPEHLTTPKNIKEESYFFRLSKYQKDILKLLEKGFVEPESRKKEVFNRVKEGLNDLSVSRKNVEWGTDVPIDKTHKIYVWIDALVNYISALDYPDGELFRKYWPADIHLIGKGINWFHSVIWPAILISAEIELPKKIFVHGYINVSGQKVSKSLGNIIDPIGLADKYGADALRYFMFRYVPFGQDGDFSEKNFAERYNSNLANNLGNLISRTFSMVEKYSLQDIKAGINEKMSLGKIQIGLEKKFSEAMDRNEFTEALNLIWNVIDEANKTIDDEKPWKLYKTDKERLKTVFESLLSAIEIIPKMILPFMPETAEKLKKMIKERKVNEPLFPRKDI